MENQNKSQTLPDLPGLWGCRVQEYGFFFPKDSSIDLKNENENCGKRLSSSEQVEKDWMEHNVHFHFIQQLLSKPNYGKNHGFLFSSISLKTRC